MMFITGGVDGGQRAAQGELGLLVVVERSSDDVHHLGASRSDFAWSRRR